MDNVCWDEEWRAIPGIDGYEVSDHGNVRSYFQPGNHTKKRTSSPRILSRRPDGHGRATVSLPVRGNYQTKRVAPLVMLAFVGPRPQGLEVAHNNGDCSDDRLSNLRYATHAENEADKKTHGTLGVGERNSQASLLGWQVAEIKFLANKGIPQGRIAALFGIDHKAVSSILTGKTWPGQVARDDIPWLLSRLRDLESEWDVLLALVDDACASDDLTVLRDWQTERLLKETQR